MELGGVGGAADSQGVCVSPATSIRDPEELQLPRPAEGALHSGLLGPWVASNWAPCHYQRDNGIPFSKGCLAGAGLPLIFNVNKLAAGAFLTPMCLTPHFACPLGNYQQRLCSWYLLNMQQLCLFGE